jgi:hypothetical protein
MKFLLPFILSAFPVAAVAQSQSPSTQPPADPPSPKTTDVATTAAASGSGSAGATATNRSGCSVRRACSSWRSPSYGARRKRFGRT